MQNSFVPQLYPEKIVPPDVMNHAESIYDIFRSVECTFSDNKIRMQYVNA